MEDKSETETEKVIYGDDLSIEILLRTPVRSLLKFQTLSKRCYSAVTNPHFLRLRNPNIDPPAGLFLRPSEAPGQYHFVSLDVENPIVTPPFTTLDFGPKPASDPIEILQSCNGLLLCGTKSDDFYVYNPTINLFTTLPHPEDEEYDSYNDDHGWHNRLEVVVCGMTLDFRPSRSPYYRVVCARYHGTDFREQDFVQILVYSSETRKWRALGKPYELDQFTLYHQGVCCNNAVHWPSIMPEIVEYFSFEEQKEHYIQFQTPTTISGEPHDDCIAESHDGMLLVGIFYSYINQFDVLKMKKDYSGWSFMYHIDFDEILTPFPEMGNSNGRRFRILSLDGGRTEGDLSIILQTPGQLLRYNIVAKTFQKLHDFVPCSLNIEACFQFIPSLSGV